MFESFNIGLDWPAALVYMTGLVGVTIVSCHAICGLVIRKNTSQKLQNESKANDNSYALKMSQPTCEKRHY